LKYQSKSDFVPTSRFGIGILSCFMVADTVVVDTRRVRGPHDSSEPLNLTIEGQESIFWIKPGARTTPGTSTKLFLRKNKNPWDRMNEDEFISSVENVIPNPPFKVLIESKSHEKVRDQNSFREIKASSLKDHSWGDNDNVRMFECEFSDTGKGFVGSAVVAILERHSEPVARIDMTSKSVQVEGVSFDLKKSMGLNNKAIDLITTSITIGEDGEIKQSSSTSRICSSKSRLSLHGIVIPSSLFPEYWELKRNEVKIDWPMPVLLVIDVCGKLDLDLNSSRTQIIVSEKWTSFEECLAFEICQRIAKAVTTKYWSQLKDVLVSNSKNETFIRSINEVSV